MGLSNTQKGILYALGGFGCFSLADSCAKWLGMHNGYDVVAILFWVYLISLGVCLLFGLPQGIKKKLGTRKPLIHIIRGFLMLALSGCAVAAFSDGMTLATLYTIIFLNPLLTTIIAIPIYKERVSSKSWSVILLGLAGVIVAFHKGIDLFDPQIIYAIGVLVVGVTINMFSKQLDKQDSILTIPFYPSVIIPPALLIYMHGQIPMPAVADIPLFVLGGITLFFATIGVVQGFRITAFAKVAPTQYVQMLYGLVIGYNVFGDFPSMWVLIGAGMIIASGLLLIMQRNRKQVT